MLQNDRQLANTRAKLRLLEDSYEEARAETDGDEELREAELESLKRFINQLKEEIGPLRGRSAGPAMNACGGLTKGAGMPKPGERVADVRFTTIPPRGSQAQDHAIRIRRQALRAALDRLAEVEKER